MGKLWSSLRFRIMQICVIFTLVLSLGLGYASYVIFEQEERRGEVQAAEFNLHLVTSLISQDVKNLNMLVSQCVTSPLVLHYLSASEPTSRQALDAYDVVQSLYSENRSSSFVQRLIVVGDRDRLLHLGSSMINNMPITRYNVNRFPFLSSPDSLGWQTVMRDPFASASFSDCIPVVQPVFARGQIRCGTAYLSVSTEIVTNQLVNYQLAENDRLYLTMGGSAWRIDGKALLPEALAEPENAIQAMARDASTVIDERKDASGEKHIVVGCPIGASGMWLRHTLPSSRFSVPSSVLWGYLLAELVVLQAFGLGIVSVLNRLIMKPVTKLQNRISAIAAGDFAKDPSVEWNNELGDIGRGVNRLSLDVQAMMDSRVADEKERQRLEYRVLQSQISPHFIYNTLNSIKWMATIQNATGIVEMTNALSHLLKYISKNSEDLITLREELALLSDYCVIQRYRYGGAVKVDIEPPRDETVYDCLIPRFTLQPLAENAIFHGIEPNGGAGTIRVAVTDLTNGDLSILVEDDGVGMTAETIQRIFSQNSVSSGSKFMQIGVSNVHRRLRYAFGPEYGISIDSAPKKGAKVKVFMPRRTRTDAKGENG